MTDDEARRMTDQEIHAHYRKTRPYISMTQGLALHQSEARYRHLLLAAQEKARLEREEKQERIRRRIFEQG